MHSLDDHSSMADGNVRMECSLNDGVAGFHGSEQ